MQPDDTIFDALPLIRQPNQYLQGVIERMNECISIHQNAYLRLGVTGTGAFPCYRIVYDDADGREFVFGSYIDSHKNFPQGFDKVTPGRWSRQRTGLHEVLVAYQEWHKANANRS